MDPKTKFDLKYLEEISKRIIELESRRRKIRDDCKHLDYKPEYTETFKYEFAPYKICIVCRKRLDPANDIEKLALLKKWYDGIDVPLTKDIINREIDGFNLTCIPLQTKEKDVK